MALITLDRARNPKALGQARVSGGVGHARGVVSCVYWGLAHGWGWKQCVDAFLFIRKQKKRLRSLATLLFLVVEGEGYDAAK